MSFRLVPLEDPGRCGAQCAQVIAADGEITDATPDQFLSFVRSNVQGNVRSVVFINSPGGKVVASMELGRVFRQLGTATVVARVRAGQGDTAHFASAHCFSACVYALMGGRKRVIPPQSQVGIHRMFSYESGMDPAGGTATLRRRYDNGDMRTMLSRYSSTMGISSGLIDFAEHTSSDSIHVLSKGEIARWRLGTPKL
ncbi:MAG: hypothetical protein NVSMB26_17300 [Beijerinckiaceae bacterium]